MGGGIQNADFLCLSAVCLFVAARDEGIEEINRIHANSGRVWIHCSHAKCFVIILLNPPSLVITAINQSNLVDFKVSSIKK